MHDVHEAHFSSSKRLESVDTLEDFRRNPFSRVVREKLAVHFEFDAAVDLGEDDPVDSLGSKLLDEVENKRWLALLRLVEKTDVRVETYPVE